MTVVFEQIIEISISMSVLILILFAFSKGMHQRYRASVVVLAWLAIALRLILPWNITLPSAAVTIPVPQRMVQPLPVGSSFTEASAGNRTAAAKSFIFRALRKSRRKPNTGNRIFNFDLTDLNGHLDHRYGIIRPSFNAGLLSSEKGF